MLGLVADRKYTLICNDSPTRSSRLEGSKTQKTLRFQLWAAKGSKTAAVFFWSCLIQSQSHVNPTDMGWHASCQRGSVGEWDRPHAELEVWQPQVAKRQKHVFLVPACEHCWRSTAFFSEGSSWQLKILGPPKSLPGFSPVKKNNCFGKLLFHIVPLISFLFPALSCFIARHPHIISYFGCHWADNHLQMYLEYMPGGSLSQAPVPEDQTSRCSILCSIVFLDSTRPHVLDQDRLGFSKILPFLLTDASCWERWYLMLQTCLTVRTHMLWANAGAFQLRTFRREPHGALRVKASIHVGHAFHTETWKSCWNLRHQLLSGLWPQHNQALTSGLVNKKYGEFQHILAFRKEQNIQNGPSKRRKEKPFQYSIIETICSPSLMKFALQLLQVRSNRFSLFIEAWNIYTRKIPTSCTGTSRSYASSSCWPSLAKKTTQRSRRSSELIWSF